MFFLKELPGREMVEGYAERYKDVDVDATLHALNTMRRASLMVRRLEAYFAEHGFSQLRFLILIVIDREPKRSGLTIGEITDRLDVSKPVMTRTLARLAEDELITIEIDQADARSKIVSLTKAGEEKLAAMLPSYFSKLAAFAQGEET